MGALFDRQIVLSMHQKNGEGELARSVITNLKYSYHLEMTKFRVIGTLNLL